MRKAFPWSNVQPYELWWVRSISNNVKLAHCPWKAKITLLPSPLVSFRLITIFKWSSAYLIRCFENVPCHSKCLPVDCCLILKGIGTCWNWNHTWISSISIILRSWTSFSASWHPKFSWEYNYFPKQRLRVVICVFCQMCKVVKITLIPQLDQGNEEVIRVALLTFALKR